MNYNQSVFIVPVGEVLSQLQHAAPWANGVELSYQQGYDLLAAIHDQVFCEIFPWASITPALDQVLQTIYPNVVFTKVGGFAIYQLVTNDQGEWGYRLLARTDDPSVAYPNAVLVGCEEDLPLASKALEGTYYAVGGEAIPTPWYAQFILDVVDPLEQYLTTFIRKYVGDRHDYEWAFDYVTNGIFYRKLETKPGVAPVQKESEYEKANTCSLSEVGQQYVNPRIPARPETTLLLDVRHDTPSGAFNDLSFEYLQQYPFYHSLMAYLLKLNGYKVLIKIVSVNLDQFEFNTVAIRRLVKGLHLDITLSFVRENDEVGVQKRRSNDREKVVGFLQEVALFKKKETRLRELQQTLVCKETLSAAEQHELNGLIPGIFQKRMNEDLGCLLTTPSIQALLSARGVNPNPSAPVITVALAIEDYIINNRLSSSLVNTIIGTKGHGLYSF